MLETKPCPFCGNDSNFKLKISGRDQNTNYYQVICKECKAKGTGILLSKQEALDQWNKAPRGHREPRARSLAGEIKPCPFCGERDSFIFGNGFVKCWSCYAMGPDAKDMKSAVAAWNSAPRAEGQVSAKVKIYQCENPICGPKSGTYVTIGDGPHWGYCGCGGRWMRASVDIGGDDSKPTKNDIKRLKDDLSNALKKAQAALSDIVKECDE